MKGKIAADGSLFIDRAGAMKKAWCPLIDDMHCGNWCAMFGEPEEVDTSQVVAGSLTISSGFRLSLCHKEIVFDSFTDERTQK